MTQRHPGLFWALVPGARLGDLTVNEAGFIGSMPALAPRDGIYRIVCLGDSNVALGSLPYPQELQNILDARAPGRFEVINAGVPGYTLLQGLRLLEGRVLSYTPDLVTIQYGWNDHWMSDKPMSQKILREPIAFGLRSTLRSLRVYQGILYLYAHLLKSAQKDKVQYNVPPDEYREYLGRIVALGSTHRFHVTLLTVPSNFKLGNLQPFLKVGFRPDHPDPKGRPEGLISVHSELNELVRDAAHGDSASLVDLEARFAGLPGRDDYFFSDAIHTNQRGRLLIAKTLAEEVLGGSLNLPRRSSAHNSSGVGRYALSDERVALRDFWPIIAPSSDTEVFQAAMRADSTVLIVGVRPALYRVRLVFAPDGAGSSLFVSADNGGQAEQIIIASDGRVNLVTQHGPDANGVLSLRLTTSISGERRDAGSERGPALVAVELSD